MSRLTGSSNAGVALVLKVVLADTEPVIWRRVSVPLHFNLAQLHEVIQLAMGWQNCHLHAFTIDDRDYLADDGDMEEEELDEMYARVADVLRVGQHFAYLYDFGDDWIHEVEVECSANDVSLSSHATCLDGQRACPPEDCGGVEGYEHFLMVLRDPTNSEYHDVIGRLSATFDADAFSLNSVNARLRDLR